MFDLKSIDKEAAQQFIDNFDKDAAQQFVDSIDQEKAAKVISDVEEIIYRLWATPEEIAAEEETESSWMHYVK